MTIDIPDDLARELAHAAAGQRKSVVEFDLERLRSAADLARSPQVVLEALRRLPHPSVAAVDDLEAAIAAGQLAVDDQDPFDTAAES